MIASFAATALALPAQAQDEARERPDPFSRALLYEHNRERALTGAPDLRWSRALQDDARRWADHLARTGRFEHAGYEQRRKAGENLWMGSAGLYSAQDMIGGFLSEKRDFRSGQFPDVSRTGRWSDVGHYTQIIWRDTREVGCAVARSRVNDVLVCRYYPSGNVISEYID